MFVYFSELDNSSAESTSIITFVSFSCIILYLLNDHSEIYSSFILFKIIASYRLPMSLVYLSLVFIKYKYNFFVSSELVGKVLDFRS